jgi:hypothetical protein
MYNTVVLNEKQIIIMGTNYGGGDCSKPIWSLFLA